jgi:hypothetical protein
MNWKFLISDELKTFKNALLKVTCFLFEPQTLWHGYFVH